MSKNEVGAAAIDAGASGVDKLRKLIERCRHNEDEIVTIQSQEKELSVEINRLEETTDMADKAAVEYLSMRRTMLGLCPGCIRRCEKAISAAESDIAELLPDLIRSLENHFREEYERILETATASLKPLYPNEATARHVAMQTPAARMAGGRIWSLQTILGIQESPARAGEQILSLLSNQPTTEHAQS